MKKKKVIGYITDAVCAILSIRSFCIMKYGTTSEGFTEDEYERWKWMDIASHVKPYVAIVSDWSFSK